MSKEKLSPNAQERAPKIEKPHSKARKFFGRLAVAAACIIPPADLALSDAVAAKEYEIVNERVELSNKKHEKGIELGILSTLGVAESVALGQVITRNKKLRNAFNDFEDYQEEKHARMGRIRKAVSKTVNAPFTALEYVADKFERVGQRFEKSELGVVRSLGKLVVETAQVNALGTSTVIMQETMANNPTSLKRQVYLGGLITGSWLGFAEVIRQGYRNIPIIRTPLVSVGRAYETLTSMDVTNPVSTPISSLAIGSTVAALGYTGWKIEEFRQKRQNEESLVHQAVVDVANGPTIAHEQ